MNYLTDKEILKLAKEANIDYAFKKELMKFAWIIVEKHNDTFRESTIDLLVGGTPCQSFSVAGLRGGLADPRGNLMLTFLGLADAKKPRWIVWENVPGVLSSNGGKDFATFLGALGELGYGFAYRVLDAQYFGVAQRRRRVFVVGYLGDWRPAAAVLFERESLSGHTKPSRKKRQEASTGAEGCAGATGDVEPVHAFKVRQGCDGGGKGYLGQDEKAFTIAAAQDQQIAQPIAYSFDSLASNSMKSSNPHSGCRAVETSKTIDTSIPEPSKNQGGIAIAQPIALAENTIGRQPMNGGNGNGFTEDGPMYTLNATGVHGVAQPIAVDWRTTQVDVEKTGTLKTDLAKMSGPCIAFDAYNQTINEKTTQTIGSSASDANHVGAVLQPIQISFNDANGTRADRPNGGCYIIENPQSSPALTLADSPVKVLQPTIIDRAAFNQGENAQYEPRIEEGQTMSSLVAKGPHAVQHTMAIRRLTPRECERLQGFPDDWTLIPYRNKPADQCPDGPRYKACGNSMAVPVMRWIGQRIKLIDTIIN